MSNNIFNVGEPISNRNNNYKTQLCVPFMRGEGCEFGTICNYAHGIGELQKKTGDSIDYGKFYHNSMYGNGNNRSNRSNRDRTERHFNVRKIRGRSGYDDDDGFMRTQLVDYMWVVKNNIIANCFAGSLDTFQQIAEEQYKDGEYSDTNMLYVASLCFEVNIIHWYMDESEENLKCISFMNPRSNKYINLVLCGLGEDKHYFVLDALNNNFKRVSKNIADRVVIKIPQNFAGIYADWEIFKQKARLSKKYIFYEAEDIEMKGIHQTIIIIF